jgi:hypothetical protein
MSPPPSFFAYRVRYTNSTRPPINLAIEKEGVFKNPIANATPEGIYFANPLWLLPE